jgi:hypothetical protein
MIRLQRPTNLCFELKIASKDFEAEGVRNMVYEETRKKVVVKPGCQDVNRELSRIVIDRWDYYFTETMNGNLNQYFG